MEPPTLRPDQREQVEHQIQEMRRVAEEARAAATAARDVAPLLAQELLLKAHNLEVTANGIARSRVGRRQRAT
jgi:hypothetical protein